MKFINCYVQNIELWYFVDCIKNLSQQKHLEKYMKNYKKTFFSRAIFGRIFGRKFRPTWPNIRFRPKLPLPLSVVHYIPSILHITWRPCTLFIMSKAQLHINYQYQLLKKYQPILNLVYQIQCINSRTFSGSWSCPK